MRIVYVEDNIANVHLVKRVARMGKHEVINYIDGMDALTNFANDNPDLVLMDIQLAGELTGIEVVKKLRDKGFNAPIYAVTAYAMVGDRERCMEAGCTGYISKPIPIPELVQLFAQYDTSSPSSETKALDEPLIASSGTEASKPNDKVKDDPDKTKILLTAATIKPSEPKEDVVKPQTEDVKQDEPVDEVTKTLLAVATIKSNKPNDDATQIKSSKSVKTEKTEAPKAEEKVTSVAEYDNDDTISVKKDKPAQMK